MFDWRAGQYTSLTQHERFTWFSWEPRLHLFYFTCPFPFLYKYGIIWRPKQHVIFVCSYAKTMCLRKLKLRSSNCAIGADKLLKSTNSHPAVSSCEKCIWTVTGQIAWVQTYAICPYRIRTNSLGRNGFTSGQTYSHSVKINKDRINKQSIYCT